MKKKKPHWIKNLKNKSHSLEKSPSKRHSKSPSYSLHSPSPFSQPNCSPSCTKACIQFPARHLVTSRSFMIRATHCRFPCLIDYSHLWLPSIPRARLLLTQPGIQNISTHFLYIHSKIKRPNLGSATDVPTTVNNDRFPLALSTLAKCCQQDMLISWCTTKKNWTLTSQCWKHSLSLREW